MSGPILVDTATPLLAQYPQLRNAMQPAYLEPTGSPIDPARNSKLFKMDNRWRRRLTATPEGLVGPIVAEGQCMPMTFESGMVALWLDPATMPEPGDMVLVRYSDADLEQMIEDGRQSPEWMATYAAKPIGNVYLKQLLLVDGFYYLAAENGALRYGNSRVLGVLRHYVEAPKPSKAAIEALMAHEVARQVSLSTVQALLRQ